MCEEDAIKLVDAMTGGFVVALICDLGIENRAIARDDDTPPGGVLDFFNRSIATAVHWHDVNFSGVPPEALPSRNAFLSSEKTEQRTRHC
jgi:hypothetical protein